MRVPSSLAVVLILMGTPFVAPATAQTTGTISGTVQDGSGAVVPGVPVAARNEATGLVRTAVTGMEGRFVLAALPPGSYEVRAALAGFTAHVRRNVTLTIAQTLNLAVVLQVGPVAVEDVVVAGVPLANTSSSELSYFVGSNSIEQLPLNGRNYTDLALLQPGVLVFPYPRRGRCRRRTPIRFIWTPLDVRRSCHSGSCGSLTE